MWMEDPGCIPLSGRSSGWSSWRWMLFRWTTKDERRLRRSVVTRRRDCPLTPAHQSHAGGRAVTLPPTPPAAGVNRRRDAWIVGDDYDGESFAITPGKPLPPLTEEALMRAEGPLRRDTFSSRCFPGAAHRGWLGCRPRWWAFSPDRGAQSCTVPTLWQQTTGAVLSSRDILWLSFEENARQL